MSLEEASGMDDPWLMQTNMQTNMAHADFGGTPTYFAVLKMMISSKNMNQKYA